MKLIRRQPTYLQPDASDANIAAKRDQTKTDSISQNKNFKNALTTAKPNFFRQATAAQAKEFASDAKTSMLRIRLLRR